eukprot:jgi/Galph1/802/GphlegSOOS_G5524.1
MKTRSGRELIELAHDKTLDEISSNIIIQKKQATTSYLSELLENKTVSSDEVSKWKKKRSRLGKAIVPNKFMSASSVPKDKEENIAYCEKEQLSDVTDDYGVFVEQPACDEQFSNVSENSTVSEDTIHASEEETPHAEEEDSDALAQEEFLTRGISTINGTVGLKNLGNTCFINSVLQALSNTERFRRFVLEEVEDEWLCIGDGHGENGSLAGTNDSRKKSALKVLILKELRDLLKNLWRKEVQCAKIDSSVSKVKGVNTKSTSCSAFSESLEDTVPESHSVSKYARTWLHCRKRSQLKSGFISPQGFLNAVWLTIPLFGSFQQADAQEFLHLMLDRVHFETSHLSSNCDDSKWNKVGEDIKSSIETIFVGCCETHVRCNSCGFVSTQQQEFLDLSLSIPKEYIHFAGRRSARLASVQRDLMNNKTEKSNVDNGVHSCSLYDCFDYFTREELLTRKDKYFCLKCNEYTDAWKTCRLVKLPEVLCVHLLRVHLVGTSRWSPMKVDTHVRFPLEGLQLQSYGRNNSSRNSQAVNMTYDLCAAIQHHGSGWHSGHYTAFCKHTDKQWYHFNDVQVEKVSDETVQNSEAYILLYSKRSEPMTSV